MVREAVETRAFQKGWRLGKESACGCAERLASPCPFNPLVVDRSFGIPQPLDNLAIAEARILTSEFDDVVRELFFIFSSRWNAVLRATTLPAHPAMTALRDAPPNSNVIDAGSTTRRVWMFARVTSATFLVSKVRSDTDLRSRAFSASSFSRRLS
jgi:hypothetical protein